MPMVIFAMSFTSLMFSICEYPDWAIFIALGLMFAFMGLGVVIEDKQEKEVRKLKQEVYNLREAVTELRKRIDTCHL